MCFCANAAPWRPFTESAAISKIVRRAIGRAGLVDVPSRGAHLLRQSRRPGVLLEDGASLETIGTEMLRHRSIETTGDLCQGRSRCAARHRPALAGGRPMLSAAVERHVALMRACGFVFDKQAGLLTNICRLRRGAQWRTPMCGRPTVLEWSRRAGTHAAAADRLSDRPPFRPDRRDGGTPATRWPPPEKKSVCLQTARQRPLHLTFTAPGRSRRSSPWRIGWRAELTVCPDNAGSCFGLIAAHRHAAISERPRGARTRRRHGARTGSLIREAKRRGRKAPAAASLRRGRKLAAQ